MMKNKDVGYSVDLTFRRQKNMKKILATALFACSLFLATPQVQAYSELDLLEGNWYDDNGKLFAIVRDGKLNTFRMDMITMAGSPGGNRQGKEQPVLPPGGAHERRRGSQGMVQGSCRRV